MTTNLRYIVESVLIDHPLDDFGCSGDFVDVISGRFCDFLALSFVADVFPEHRRFGVLFQSLLDREIVVITAFGERRMGRG